MADTSLSLLQRIRSRNDDSAWRSLTDVYEPMLRAWLRRYDLPASDVDDLVQEVLAVVVRRVGEFERQRTGSFRSWLRTIMVNCLKKAANRGARQPTATGDSGFLEMLAQLADPRSEVSRLWDSEYDRHVMQKLLNLVQPQFRPTTWQAFVRVVLQNESPDEVAAEIGISVNAVFIAKSRVLARLREEGRDLID